MMGYLNNAGLGTLWKNIVGKSVPYGYCTTGASTRAKTVTVSPAITELTAGVQILVKFQYANTASTTSSAVTLNVNGLGAKDIKRYGSTNISNSAATSWNANSVVLLTYDGSYWQLTDYNNTTYSGMTDAEVNAGTSGTNRLITPARLKYAIQHWATGEANVQSDWSQTDDTADDYIKNKPTIPSKTSDLTNDSGFITEEADPTVPAWAKASTKPAYTASEILYNAQVTVAQAFNTKVDKVTGKGLSTNDYTTEEKEKLAGIATGAEVNVNADWNATSGDAQILNKPTIPTKTSDLTNDSNFVADASYVHTDNNYTDADVSKLSQSLTSAGLRDAVSREIVNLVVSGSTATLYLMGSNPRVADAQDFFYFYSTIDGLVVIQILNNAQTLTTAQIRAYEVAEVDATTASVRLESVDNGVIYRAELQDTGNGLTGSFSTQTIGTLTTETDPTVPSWAKASTKPSYEADEISFSVPQAYEVGNATDVEGAILDLDEAVTNAKSTASSAHTLASDALPKSGGQLTGDLTLYVASGNSPAIIFQRGTLTDNYNDWKIYDKSGFLYFAQRGSGSSAFGDMGYIDTSGVLHFNIPWGNVTGKPTFATVATSGSYADLSNKPTIPSSANDFASVLSNTTLAEDITELDGLITDVAEWVLPAVTSSDNGKVLRVVNGAWSAVALPSASGVSF